MTVTSSESAAVQTRRHSHRAVSRVQIADSGKSLHEGLHYVASLGPKNDRDIFRSINEDIFGVIVADAGYVSKKLERDMNIDGKRWVMIRPVQEHEKACDRMAGQTLSLPLLNRVRLPLDEAVPWPREFASPFVGWHDGQLFECRRFVCA